MSQAELSLHRFRECTLLMPTWFMARPTFEAGALASEPGAAEAAGGERPTSEVSTGEEASTSDAGTAATLLLPFREEQCEDMLFLQAR